MQRGNYRNYLLVIQKEADRQPDKLHVILAFWQEGRELDTCKSSSEQYNFLFFMYQSNYFRLFTGLGRLSVIIKI